jgi:hypothetical protein
MTFKPHHLCWLAGWGLAAFAVLQLERLPGSYGHFLCGPWGCLPPLQALAAMHLFWIFLLAPLLIWGLYNWSPRGRWWAGVLFLAIGLAGIGIVFIRESATWLLSVPPDYRKYLPQRLVFSLATLSDWPLVQVTIVGAVWRFSARNRKKVNEEEYADSPLGETTKEQDNNPQAIEADHLPL